MTTFSTPLTDDPSTSQNAARQHVLIVEDEAPLRRMLERYLASLGYSVEGCDCGEAAMLALGSRKFAAMISDIRMPGINGLEVLARARAADADLAVVMLTGVDDAATATHALSSGAMDYLTKPFELHDLQKSLATALRKRRAAMDHRRIHEWIREEVTRRTADLEREKTALRDLSVGIVETLVNAMETKDPYLRGHSRRVAIYAGAIAAELGLAPDVTEQIRLAGRLQDVGRIGVREAVLNKRETLTDAEVEHIRDHVRLGVEILGPLHLGDVLTFIADHHEHWDGGGYPHALSGEAISIGGRVLAAADAFDALTTRRPYRDSMSPQVAVRYMETLSGSLLDPRVYEALKRVVQTRDYLLDLESSGGLISARVA